MTQDLSTLLREAAQTEEQHARDTAPDPHAETARIAALASRRRRTRTAGLSAGLAAAAVVAGLLAVEVPALPSPTLPAWLDPDRGDSPPDDGQVVEDPALPDAAPMPDGALESAGPGWALVLYTGGAAGSDAVPTRLYLVGPAGERYLVPHALEDLRDDGGLTGLQWLPGTTLVLADAPGTGWVVLDVLDGRTVAEVTPSGPSREAEARWIGDGTTDILVQSPGALSLSRVTLAGAPVAETTLVLAEPDADPGRGWSVSPDGRFAVTTMRSERLVTDLGDFSAGPLLTHPYPGDACAPAGWAADEVVLLTCHGWGDDDGEARELWLAPLDGAEPSPVAIPADTAQSVWSVDGRTVVRVRQDDPARLVLATPDGDPVLDLDQEDTGGSVRLVGVEGGSLLAVVVGTPPVEAWRLVRIDAGTGAVTELVPAPERPVAGAGMLPLGVVGGEVRPEPR